MVNIAKYLYILNGTQYLRNHIDKYVDAFAEYYGEENREQIIEKFSNGTIFVTVSPEILKRTVWNADKEISSSLVEEFIKKSQFDFTEELLTRNSSLYLFKSTPLSYLNKFYELLLMGKDGRKKMFIERGYAFLQGFFKDLTIDDYNSLLNNNNLSAVLDKVPEFFKSSVEYYFNLENSDDTLKRSYENCYEILKKISPNMTIENAGNYIDSFAKLNRLSNVMLSKYDIFREPIKKYEEEFNSHDAKSDELKNKYLRELIKENFELIPSNEKIEAQEYINGKRDSHDLGPYTKFLFKINFASNISCFNKESEVVLNDPNSSEWKRTSIFDDRIQLFKIFGVDHGSNYYTYLQDERVQFLIDKLLKLADYIEEKIAKNQNAYNIELINNYDRYQSMKEEIDKIGVLEKNHSLNQSLFIQSSNTFVTPNLIKQDNELKLHPLVSIGADSYSQGFLDHVICHELNHLFELKLTRVGNTDFSYICGWDDGTDKLVNDAQVDTLSESTDKRPYELLNEIINELISQDISEIMHKNKSYVFDNPENSKYKGYTSYEETSFIVRSFFNEFKDEIIKSRRDGNCNILFDVVGKENFEKLNSLVIEFVNNVSGFKYFSMVDSVKNNVDNELTRYYKSVVEKRDNILNNMRNYKQNVMEEKNEQGVHL